MTSISGGNGKQRTREQAEEDEEKKTKVSAI